MFIIISLQGWDMLKKRLLTENLMLEYPMSNFVLIIEDDTLIATVEKQYLEKNGFRVLTVNTGGAALQLINKGDIPDLLIIDYRLPDMSGVEFMQKLKELQMNIPSIIVTGGGNETIAVTAMKLGAMDYIIKGKDTVKQLPEICRDVIRKFNISEENLRLMEELKKANMELTEINRQLDDLSKKDDLTGIFNRRYLMESLSYEIARSKRYSSPLSFAIFDLDHFKQINDAYGHTTGDLVLKQFALLLKERLRKTDVVGRYGGEEFGIVLTGITLDSAFTLCNELRELVSAMPFGYEHSHIQLTTSAGIASLTDNMDRKTIIDTADKSLYKAKASGRNLVIALQQTEGQLP